MDQLITEAQALATVAEDQFEAALATHVANLQAFVPTSEPVVTADPIVSVTTTTHSGVTAVFVPQV